MIGELEAFAFGGHATAEVARFIDEATGGGMSAARAAFVIEQIIAGPEAVLDLWRGGHRVAVAVAVDNCETVGNAAELSVFRADATDDEAVRAAVAWADRRAAEAGRAHVDIAPWPGARVSPPLLAGLGFAAAYRMFHMTRADYLAPPRQTAAPLPDGFRWCSASLEFGDAYYETVAAAFADLPGSYVSSRDDILRRLVTKGAPTALLLGPDPSATCAGFVRVERRDDGRGEVASLGRHPQYRGRGLGEHLVARGLATLFAWGCVEQVLEVAAVNTAALELYESFGFAVTDEVVVHRRPVSSEAKRLQQLRPRAR